MILYIRQEYGRFSIRKRALMPGLSCFRRFRYSGRMTENAEAGAPSPLQEAAVTGLRFEGRQCRHLIRLRFAREKKTHDEVFLRLEKMKAFLPTS